MSVIVSIFAVFTQFIEWLVEAIPSITGIFYVAETGLTFIGVLAVASLAMSVAFLLFGLVQRFVKFKG